MTTNATDRFLATARRQRLAMIRDLLQAAAMTGLGFATLLGML